MSFTESKSEAVKIDPAIFTDAVARFLPVLVSLVGRWQTDMLQVFPHVEKKASDSKLQEVFFGGADPVAFLQLRMQSDILQDATKIFTSFVKAKDVVEEINKLNMDLVAATARSSQSMDDTVKMIGFTMDIYEETHAQGSEEKASQRDVSRKCIKNICCALTSCAPKAIAMAALNGASPSRLEEMERKIVQPALEEFRRFLLKGADALYAKPETDPQPRRFH